MTLKSYFCTILVSFWRSPLLLFLLLSVYLLRSKTFQGGRVRFGSSSPQIGDKFYAPLTFFFIQWRWPCVFDAPWKIIATVRSRRRHLGTVSISWLVKKIKKISWSLIQIVFCHVTLRCSLRSQLYDLFMATWLEALHFKVRHTNRCTWPSDLTLPTLVVPFHLGVLLIFEWSARAFNVIQHAETRWERDIMSACRRNAAFLQTKKWAAIVAEDFYRLSLSRLENGCCYHLE